MSEVTWIIEAERRLRAVEAVAHQPVTFVVCPVCAALVVDGTDGLDRHLGWHEREGTGRG